MSLNFCGPISAVFETFKSFRVVDVKFCKSRQMLRIFWNAMLRFPAFGPSNNLKTPVLGLLGLEQVTSVSDQGLQGDFMWHRCFVSQNHSPSKHECFVSQRFIN